MVGVQMTNIMHFLNTWLLPSLKENKWIQDDIFFFNNSECDK